MAVIAGKKEVEENEDYLVVEPLVEGEDFATGADGFGGDQENTIIHRHESRVAIRSLGLGVGEARDANLSDIPLHGVFIRNRRIKAPDGISDTLDVSGLTLSAKRYQ